MPKYKVVMIYDEDETEEQDEVFDTEEEAEEYGGYLASCSSVGAETLHMSNPGDYPYDPDTFETPDWEVIEIDDDE